MQLMMLPYWNREFYIYEWMVSNPLWELKNASYKIELFGEEVYRFQQYTLTLHWRRRV